ncbi:hypothetical protein COLO4_12307 [Corchorus olitorius]|uniref:Uncharacterized protein n=1 Tax=Corchorus olitorius TaxID=93759 RepID=A0A1R3K194_9ROSI|nr:hypothetical protein COLO4_12307 [Corchorus olitorius]
MAVKLHQDTSLHLLNTAPRSTSCESSWVLLDLALQMAKPQAFRSENLTVEWCRISGKRRNNGTGKGKKNEEKPRKKASIQGISKTGYCCLYMPVLDSI